MRELLRELELAGIVTEQGTLDRPSPIPLNEMLPLPYVELMKKDGELCLVWSFVTDAGVRKVASIESCLDDFVALAEAKPPAILAFAQKYGLLMLCPHGLPIGHITLSGAPLCRPLGWLGPCYEPLSIWYYFARNAKAVLSIAANLHQGRPSSPADFYILCTQHPKRGVPGGLGDPGVASVVGDPWVDLWDASGVGVDVQRAIGRARDTMDFSKRKKWRIVHFLRTAVSMCVQQWLLLGNIQPGFSWGENNNNLPRLLLVPQGLFSVLAIKLAFAVARAEGVATCVACGNVYIPKRRPAKGRRSFCQTCGKQGSNRLAQRDSRARHSTRAITD